MLSTERLIIRPFRERDYRDLREYLSLKETYRFEPGEPVSLEEAKKLCRERAKGKNFWAAILKDNQKLIGHVSFFQTEPGVFLTWEVGYIFHPAFQNQGYATEATRAIIRYAFTELHAHRVIGHCNPENIPSWKVLEKCGMRREALFKKQAFFRKNDSGEPIWFDAYEYAILAEEFS
jgi:ribosomal-protein-alanine N-acetyltransferase